MTKYTHQKMRRLVITMLNMSPTEKDAKDELIDEFVEKLLEMVGDKK